MDKTLWHHEEKKWKPRNKQAALITRRANPLLLHTPPPEPPTIAPTHEERIAQESQERRLKIEALELESKLLRERRAAERASKTRPPKPKVWKNMWAAKAAKKMAKLRGLPAPTSEQLRVIRKAQPNYGKPL